MRALFCCDFVTIFVDDGLLKVCGFGTGQAYRDEIKTCGHPSINIQYHKIVGRSWKKHTQKHLRCYAFLFLSNNLWFFFWTSCSINCGIPDFVAHCATFELLIIERKSVFHFNEVQSAETTRFCFHAMWCEYRCSILLGNCQVVLYWSVYQLNIGGKQVNLTHPYNNSQEELNDLSRINGANLRSTFKNCIAN